MCGPSGGGGGPADNGQAARDNETNRNHAINAGMTNIDNQFDKFDEPYYADFEKKNVDLARPNIDFQTKEAQNQTLYGLARSGNLSSSTAGKQYADVEMRRDQALQQASDQAHSATSGLRADVENERGSLVNNLNSTADAGAAATDATNQAALLTRPPTYSPITGIFADITGQIAANEAARRGGLPGWGFGISSPGIGPTKAGSSVTYGA